MKKLLFVPILLIALSGCSFLDGGSLLGKFRDLEAKGEGYAAVGIAEIVIYRCETMSPVQRGNLLYAVNDELKAKGSVAEASALDCDGDGFPDDLEPK